MTPEQVGNRDGVDDARKHLAQYQRIARAWAEAKVAVIAHVLGESDYARGYLDGYQATLTSYLRATEETP